jgi:ketosteroid isomerase-like protein
MTKAISLIAGVVLMSFPPITSIPATISPGSTSLSVPFQEKGGEPSPQNRAASIDEEQVKILVKQFLQTESENDPGTLEKITTDDWVIMNPNGPGPSKLKVIADMRKDSPNPPHYSVKNDGETVHVFGNTAVVTYTKVYVSSQGQVDKESHTDVLTKRDGNWKICFSQSSALPQTKP